MSSRRRWWDLALIVVLVAAGLIIGITRSGSSACASAAVPSPDVPPVFASPGSAVVRTDPHLQRLIAEVRRSGFGQVIAAVGYDQTSWLRSAALPDGFATWTADNAVVGFRDTHGDVRWGLRQTSDQQAWAVLGTAFVSLDLRPGKPVRVASYGAETGALDWCADVGKPTRYGDPLTAAAGGAGSAWIVTAGPTLNRVDTRGAVGDATILRGVDRAAYVRQIGAELIIGGRAASLLSAPDPKIAAPSVTAVTAFDVRTMRPLWRWGAGALAHVVGEADGTLIVEAVEQGRLRLVALDLAGRERWRMAAPSGTTTDMRVVSPDTLVMRTAGSISGYSLRTGVRQWMRTVGAVFPDGFDLARQAEVRGRLLLGTTAALLELDPATGRIARYALPTDGSAPTYWPYEVVASERSVIVETNVGAVLVALPVSGRSASG